MQGYAELPVSNPVEASWNYKEDDEVTQRKLEAVLKRRGQLVNLIVRELGKGKYEVINGNHRLRALLALGARDALCYNLGHVKDAAAKQIAIETNELHMSAVFAKLAELTKSLYEDIGEEALLASTSISSAGLSDLVQYAERYGVEDTPRVTPGADTVTLRFGPYAPELYEELRSILNEHNPRDVRAAVLSVCRAYSRKHSKE